MTIILLSNGQPVETEDVLWSENLKNINDAMYVQRLDELSVYDCDEEKDKLLSCLDSIENVANSVIQEIDEREQLFIRNLMCLSMEEVVSELEDNNVSPKKSYDRWKRTRQKIKRQL